MARVEGERLREAPVLGADHLAAREQTDEVVLDRLRPVLAGEGGGGLAGARQADDQDRPLAGIGRDDLAAGMHGQPTGVEHLRVPHPQAALLRLPEVVGVQDTRHAGLEVDRDEPIVGVARHGEVGGVDHHQLGLPVGRQPIGREVQLLLHAGDVRVRGLDVEAGAGSVLAVIADEAVHHHHLALRRCTRPGGRPPGRPRRG